LTAKARCCAVNSSMPAEMAYSELSLRPLFPHDHWPNYSHFKNIRFPCRTLYTYSFCIFHKFLYIQPFDAWI
jgi:hypothetical protein